MKYKDNMYISILYKKITFVFENLLMLRYTALQRPDIITTHLIILFMMGKK